MLTDLFALTRGLDPALVELAVPPACRTGVTIRERPERRADEIVIESPEWQPRRPARHFVPAFSLIAGVRCAFRFELAIATDAGWTPWVASAPIGDGEFDATSRCDDVRCDIDVYSTAPAHAARLRVRVRGEAPPAVLEAPWLVTLSACDASAVALGGAHVGRAHIAVPARSQMVEPEAVRRRICSPTSVAMVLERWGRRLETLALAEEIFHAATDRYGVWPAAIGAAARHGVAGYLLRFPDWRAAAWCLDAGLPIVASVNYRQGELAGAAMDETDGHLLVLTGYDGDAVLVNDPAAPTHEDVRRRLHRGDLERVWLERTGVGYVLFDAFGTR
jgi:hypothetical protein